MPALSLGAELVLRFGLEDRRGVGPTHARLLHRLRVGLGQRSEPARGDRVRVDAARVDLVRGQVGGVRDDVAGDLSQPALLTDGDGWLVEGHAAADSHEVALAGRGRLLRRVEQRGVTVVDDDVATVDATRGVAPVGERHGLLGELRFQTRLDGVRGVVEHGDVDGLGSHAAHRGGTAGSRLADLADPGPDAVGRRARRQRPSGRRRCARRRGRNRHVRPGDHDGRHQQRQRRLSEFSQSLAEHLYPPGVLRSGYSISTPTEPGIAPQRRGERMCDTELSAAFPPELAIKYVIYKICA